MEIAIIGILVFLIICAVICASVGYYRYTKLVHKQVANRNNVHFYVARDKSGALWLYMGKPIRTSMGFLSSHYCRFLGIGAEFSQYGLNMHDFDNLKWEDEPVEVFLNLE